MVCTRRPSSELRNQAARAEIAPERLAAVDAALRAAVVEASENARQVALDAAWDMVKDWTAEERQAMRDGVLLSALVERWRQLPRDWVDFIETGEISGALETAFISLEEEAARAWGLAQKRLTEILPKVLYFFVLLVAAAEVFSLIYKVIIAPITSVQDTLNSLNH